jgi:hypothetical protein
MSPSQEEKRKKRQVLLKSRERLQKNKAPTTLFHRKHQHEHLQLLLEKTTIS